VYVIIASRAPAVDDKMPGDFVIRDANGQALTKRS
jgi:hypothetical protein